MNHYRHFIFLSLFLSLLYTVTAQKINEDSLQQIIKHSRYDTARADALLALANYQLKHKSEDSAGLKTLGQANALSEKARYKHGLLQVLLTTGNYYRAKNNWANSLHNYQEIVNRTENDTDTLLLKARMMAFNNLGNVFNFNGDFNGSLGYRLKALEIAEKLPVINYSFLGIIMLNITSDYRKLNIPEKALHYLRQVTAFYPQLTERLKMEYFYEYHEVYSPTDSAALAYAILDSISYGLKHFNLSPFQQQDFTQMYYKLSGLYHLEKKNDPASAIPIFQQSLEFAREMKSLPEITSALYNLGMAYAGQNRIRDALNYFQASFDSSVSQSLKNMTLKNARQLAKYWQLAGNNGSAIAYLQKAMELQEQIYDDEKTRQLNFLEARYQAEKKENEIKSLELKNAEARLVLGRRNRILVLTGILSVALILVLLLLYRSARQKRLLAEKDKTIQQDHIRFLERQQQVVSLQSMINGQETERTRIARDLHDGLSGMFSTVRMYCSSLVHEKTELKENPVFRKTVEMIDQAADEIRRIAHNMMPEVLMKLGLVHAMQDLCANISAGKLLQVRLQAYGMDQRMNPSTEIMLYRILQELLNNIIKHARATEAIIQFNRDGNRLMVTVEDNGRGFDQLKEDGALHAGLDTVKSRVDYLNGQITIDSQLEMGTTITMEFLIHEEV